MLGRVIKTEYGDAAFEEYSYNPKGQMVKQRDPDGVLTLYAYNARGERDTTAVRAEKTQGNSIEFAGTDRITRTLRDVLVDPTLGTPVQRSRVYVLDAFHSNKPTLVTSFQTSTDGLKSWYTTWVNNVAVTASREVSYGPDGDRRIRDRGADRNLILSQYHLGRLDLVQNFSATNELLSQTSFKYDPHNRMSAVLALNGASTNYTYNAADRIVTMTTMPGPGHEPQTVLTRYDLMLQPTNTVLPDKAEQFTDFFLTGEVRKRYGSRVYPIEYTCDYAGRITSIKTWRDSTNASTAAVTTWNYDPVRGWLNSKRYPDGLGPDYRHFPSGKLRKRIWARETSPGSGVRVETTYTYSPAGDLESVNYNDGLTASLRYSWDRRGRLANILQGEAATSLAYNSADLLVSELYNGGILDGLVISNRYDHLLRRESLALHSSCAALEVSYDYDLASRLHTVANKNWKATYSYGHDSALTQELTFTESSQIRLKVNKQEDWLNRLAFVSASPEQGPPLSFYCQYDQANQLIQVDSTNTPSWSYTYDPLGQMASVTQFASNRVDSPQQFAYLFDSSGNRLSAQFDNNQGAQKINTYIINDPNQIVTRSSDGHSERVSYDADGDLSADDQWNYTWDAENRLVRLTSRDASKQVQRIEFAYDWLGRRIAKKVWDAAGDKTASSNLKFAYNGWNPVAVFNERGLILQSFIWGLDLKGTFQDAGGVGGLVMFQDNTTCLTNQVQPVACPITYFPVYDAHGNLISLVDARDGRFALSYAYGPFGESLDRRSADDQNPFRYSTRYEDKETGFSYYGFRYYDPSTGRWLSRDPLTELAFSEGTDKLPQEFGIWAEPAPFEAGDYVFLRNCPVSAVDLFGLASSCDQQVQNAFESSRNHKLLQKIWVVTGTRPNISGADQEGYCQIPGFLGDYQCPHKEGKICCFNVNRGEMEKTVHHELIHALDCCHDALGTCQDHVCSEIVAYYYSQCERFSNPLQCALQQMRLSVQDPQCAPVAAAANWDTARSCLKAWKKRLQD